MTSDVFYSAPCLSSDLPVLTAKELLKKSFKGSDRRYMSQALQKFKDYNRDYLDFLGVKTIVSGIDPNVTLTFETGGYIGAVPLRMPSNGKQAGDLLIYPKFSGGADLFEQLTKILMMIGENIRPEFKESIPLTSGNVVRPPLYYDAVKFIDIFELAERENWKKFKTQQRDYPFPKASTSWDKYIMREHDPAYKFIYPVRENAHSNDHDEWRGLKYVFNLAKAEVLKASTPSSIRYKIMNKMDAISQRTVKIQQIRTSHFLIHAADPLIIKQLKEQANIFLRQDNDEIGAWRIDVTQLFEKYVQHVLAQVLREMPAKMSKNHKFAARGHLHSWGLHYLEPDIIIHSDRNQVVADVKYKPHYYSRGKSSDILKETHRADLHQILAYCSFTESKDKSGLLFYPADKCGYEKIIYTNSFNSVKNTVFIFGIPFSADILPETHNTLRGILAETLFLKDTGTGTLSGV
jgi:hypothetical protein